MPSQPTGFLLTWTTYGTWLHGDVRGSVRRELIGTGDPVIESDEAMLATMRRKMVQDPWPIDGPARSVIEATVAEVCRHRKWYPAALNVRTNHVHAVVCGPHAPEKMLGDLKAWCTQRLRERDLVAADRRVWTDGGSTRYLWDEDALAAAVEYVVRGQGGELPRG
ncbi:MAG: hypothetical protein KF696_04950 [Planctomycetes bacterium]|nr:hypothetical protein [Planctomycetota bacterium]MCW8134322.1 hypothetical protein [Planctomycetota bacterium]